MAGVVPNMRGSNERLQGMDERLEGMDERLNRLERSVNAIVRVLGKTTVVGLAPSTADNEDGTQVEVPGSDVDVSQPIPLPNAAQTRSTASPPPPVKAPPPRFDHPPVPSQ